jgi:hypothetical protein
VPRKNRPGKGTGLAHTVADHGRRLTKAERELKAQAADLVQLTDIVVDEQLPDAVSGIRKRARRRATKK